MSAENSNGGNNPKLDNLYKNAAILSSTTAYDSSDIINSLGATQIDSHNQLRFAFPNFGVNEIMNDVSNWQRQLTHITGEPGYFYFKIFFNFDSHYGLLSNLLSDSVSDKKLYQNSAIFYLASVEDYYTREKISHRMLALYKFGALLRTIQTDTPWFFKGVNGLDKLNGLADVALGKERTIEIVCNTESVDMRLGTLFDLYKYATYDSINFKDILPSNLRKFDMSIITYHMPIRYLQTNIQIKRITERSIKKENCINAKSMTPAGDDFSNVMSYKMYTFKNCEIVRESLDTSTPGSLVNETAFNMGNNSIKISYDRVYEHRMNEWGQFMVGDTGFYYNEFAPDVYIGSGILRDGSESYTINKSQNNKHKERIDKILQVNTGDKFGTLKNILQDFTEYAIRDIDIDAAGYLDDFSMTTGSMTSIAGNVPSSTLRKQMQYFKDGGATNMFVRNPGFTWSKSMEHDDLTPAGRESRNIEWRNQKSIALTNRISEQQDNKHEPSIKKYQQLSKFYWEHYNISTAIRQDQNGKTTLVRTTPACGSVGVPAVGGGTKPYSDEYFDTHYLDTVLGTDEHTGTRETLVQEYKDGKRNYDLNAGNGVQKINEYTEELAHEYKDGHEKDPSYNVTRRFLLAKKRSTVLRWKKGLHKINVNKDNGTQNINEYSDEYFDTHYDLDRKPSLTTDIKQILLMRAIKNGRLNYDKNKDNGTFELSNYTNELAQEYKDGTYNDDVNKSNGTNNARKYTREYFDTHYDLDRNPRINVNVFKQHAITSSIKDGKLNYNVNSNNGGGTTQYSDEYFDTHYLDTVLGTDEHTGTRESLASEHKEGKRNYDVNSGNGGGTAPYSDDYLNTHYKIK
jgi:hypothetical protein